MTHSLGGVNGQFVAGPCSYAEVVFILAERIVKRVFSGEYDLKLTVLSAALEFKRINIKCTECHVDETLVSIKRDVVHAGDTGQTGYLT